ncbi:MAG: hypothetical protein MUD01_10945 [Chloroflexaceae bacterium]|jgi:hypothetical protein|nr:hypothetical protein [Chloroflexaceae bacterium]
MTTIPESRTLVGTFSSFAQAEAVVPLLLEAGFQQENISLVGHEGEQIHETRADGTAYNYQESQSYADWVRNGGALVVIDTAGVMVERAFQVLNRAGANEVHQHAGNERMSGWSVPEEE